MTYRVIQWATGAMGKTCLRTIIDHPDLELAGLYVYGYKKAGRDAGDIAYRDETGVVATRDIEDILAIDADIVIHAARLQPRYDHHDGDILRLLESGKNVVSINGNSFPAYWPEDRRRRFEEACAKGGTSFGGAGLNPGFAAERLLATALEMTLAPKSATLSEIVITKEVKSSQYVFDILGFGSMPGDVDPNSRDWVSAQTLHDMFSETAAAMADRLGVVPDEIVTDHGMRPAHDDMEIAAGAIPKGGACHFDWRWKALKDGTPVATVHIIWAMDKSYIADDEPLWRLSIDGTPKVDLVIELKPPEQRDGRTSAEQIGVAATVINAIPRIVEAPTGLIAATGDLVAPLDKKNTRTGGILNP